MRKQRGLLIRPPPVRPLKDGYRAQGKAGLVTARLARLFCCAPASERRWGHFIGRSETSWKPQHATSQWISGTKDANGLTTTAHFNQSSRPLSSSPSARSASASEPLSRFGASTRFSCRLTDRQQKHISFSAAPVKRCG
nr:MAG TPA: hypothetical protein [Caudoviricetes sp.]